MKKNSIVQFVCFVTDHTLEIFGPEWEYFAKRFMNNNTEQILQQQLGESKNKFQFISQHEWPNSDFQFKFMKERRSEHFPVHTVRVMQAGGYIPLQQEKRKNKETGDIKLLAFVSHDESDIKFYRGLTLYSQLNIYQAYYESCTYGYVMEFFVPKADANELLLLLKQRTHVETGLYKECLVPHA